MVDKTMDPGRMRTAAEAGEDDPTLEIVRQLIDESEAIPAPPPKPKGPPTPRPAPAVGAVRIADPVAAPVQVPMQAPVQAHVQTPVQAHVQAPVPDRDPDVWEDDDAPESWDALTAGAPVGGYRIVDVETGTVIEAAGAPELPAPALPRPVPLWRRLLGALGRWTMARLAGLAARIGRFLRRRDAPRRLAIGLLLIFVILWPGKVFGLTLLVPLGLLVLWSSVGSSGVRELVIAWYGRLKARDSAKAERIRTRAARTSAVINHALERLPRSWTHGRFLPDFETGTYVPEKLKVDSFEELAARVHSAKRSGEPG